MNRVPFDQTTMAKVSELINIGFVASPGIALHCIVKRCWVRLVEVALRVENSTP